MTCCLLLSRLTDSGPDPSYSAWQSEPVDFSLPVVLKNQVLLVVGTASNSIYVYDNGVVLASIVLPSTPSQMYVALCEPSRVVRADDRALTALSWSMGSPGTLKHVYLVVKCSDVNQCLYLLKLERRAGQSTMEILQGTSISVQAPNPQMLTWTSADSQPSAMSAMPLWATSIAACSRWISSCCLMILQAQWTTQNSCTHRL